MEALGNGGNKMIVEEVIKKEVAWKSCMETASLSTQGEQPIKEGSGTQGMREVRGNTQSQVGKCRLGLP